MGYTNLLPFRPTNVVHQLGTESRVPLMNGRHVLDTLAPHPFVLWAPGVPHPAAAPALLRAAAHLRSVVALTLAPGSTDPEILRRRCSPATLFHAATRAAEDVAQAPPFVLHVQEPPLETSEGPAFEAVRDHLALCLQAGFTSFGIDLTICPREEVAAMATRLLGPVLDMELCVMIRLSEPGLEGRLAVLKNDGIQADLVIVEGMAEAGEAAVQRAAELAPLMAPSAVGWTDAPRRGSPLPPRRDLARGFVRALVGGERLGGLAATPDDPVDAGRIEALAYMEASTVLEGLGDRDSATRLAETFAP